MLCLVAYDVSTETADGRRRLRQVAKICVSFGQRVQKSVFECELGDRELVRMRRMLLSEMDLARDNLRIYRIGEADRPKVEAYGLGKLWDYQGPLLA